MKKRSGKRGFTLIELCIVIALLGILSGVGVASYGPLKEQAADHTAERQLYNIRESFLHTKSMAEAGGQIPNTTISVTVGKESTEELSLYFEDKMENQLPELTGAYNVEAQSTNGALTYTIRYWANGKTYTLTENGTVSIVVGGNLGDPDMMEKLHTVIKKSVTTNYVDFCASKLSSTSHAAHLLNAFAAAGIDLSSMNAATWHYNKPNDVLYWTTLDVSTFPLPVTVPVIRYNFSSKTYTIWIATIKEGTSEAAGEGTFPAMKSFSAYTDSTNRPQAEQTYKNALTDFAAAMKKYGFTS